jgi:hypothetical protein
MIRDHVDQFGTAPDGRLFRTYLGGVYLPSRPVLNLTWADGPEPIPRIFREPRLWAASGVWLHMIEATPSENTQLSEGLAWLGWAPPTGFEPALTAPEAVALSPELRGPGDATRLPAWAGSAGTQPIVHVTPWRR